jgi:hypothetical protein
MPGSHYREKIMKSDVTEKKAINCWEYKKCGREPGGHQAGKYGVCPASIEKDLDGVHGGENAGRSCWVVEGTMCDDDVQGTFAGKIDHCFQCDFYAKVRKEEAARFENPGKLLNRLKKPRNPALV